MFRSQSRARLSAVARHIAPSSAASSASAAAVAGGQRAFASASASAASAAASSAPKSKAQLRADGLFQQELDNIRAARTYKNERVIESAQAADIKVGGKQVINFCANNYLGLANVKEVIEASKRALDERGHGLASVRFICGTQDIHRHLEKSIAKFHGMDDAILYASCFDANAGIFEVLTTPEDMVISDELNHASIIDGIRLCKAQKSRYKHMDMADLEAKLQEAAGARMRLIVTDGAFSMDGDIAPLREICALADRYDALVMIDDCHASGFLGKTGRGSPEYCGVKVDIVNSTLGKALGGAIGGFTTGSQNVVDMLRQRSRPYLFSNSLPPAVVGSATYIFDEILLKEDNSRLAQLQNNTKRFRSRMKEAGFTISGNDAHPIAPVMLGDAGLATDFADRMLKEGIYVIGFSFPVVPKGKARIRVQLSAAHTTQEVDRAVDAFIKIGTELGVIGKK